MNIPKLRLRLNLESWYTKQTPTTTGSLQNTYLRHKQTRQTDFEESDLL